jgi:hypothetical protein
VGAEGLEMRRSEIYDDHDRYGMSQRLSPGLFLFLRAALRIYMHRGRLNGTRY